MLYVKEICLNWLQASPDVAQILWPWLSHKISLTKAIIRVQLHILLAVLTEYVSHSRTNDVDAFRVNMSLKLGIYHPYYLLEEHLLSVLYPTDLVHDTLNALVELFDEFGIPVPCRSDRHVLLSQYNILGSKRFKESIHVVLEILRRHRLTLVIK